MQPYSMLDVQIHSQKLAKLTIYKEHMNTIHLQSYVGLVFARNLYVFD